MNNDLEKVKEEGYKMFKDIYSISKKDIETLEIKPLKNKDKYLITATLAETEKRISVEIWYE